jgi:long-subunit fatty acid transport protein
VKALACIALLAGSAAADPLDELGFGAAATGMANARGAISVGAEAIHTNPAGLVDVESAETLLGWGYAHERLSINGQDAGVLDAHGTSFGLALPIRIPSLKLAAGIATYLPDQFLARLQFNPVAEPHYVRFQSQAHRVVLEPAVAIELGPLAIGVGASLLADAKSKRIDLNVGVVGGEKQGDARIDISLPVRVAPLVGVRYRVTPALTLAAMFRGQLAVDLALDIRTDVDVPNVVSGDADVTLRATSYFTPMKVAVAAAYRLRHDLAITADVSYERYSALGSAVPDLRVLLALDIMPTIVSSMQPPAGFRDIVTPRLGAEWQREALRLRTGVAYLPSPVPPQTGITSFADGDRLLATAGVGLRIEPNTTWRRPIDLDLAIAWQHVESVLTRKDQTLQPGGAFTSGGQILQASASATVRF